MAEHENGSAYESRIDPSDLQIGHFVTRLDIPWSETRFPLQGVLVDNGRKKRWMKEHCAWVVICRERSPNKWLPARRTPVAPQSGGAGPVRRLALGGEVNAETLERALEIYGSLDSRFTIWPSSFAWASKSTSTRLRRWFRNWPAYSNTTRPRWCG